MTLLRQTGQATHFKHMTGDDFTPSEWTRTTYCACSRALLTQYAKHTLVLMPNTHWCSWPTIIMKIIILLSHSMLLTYLPLLRAKVFIGQGKQTALPKLTLAKHWCELKIIKYCNCSASIPYYGGEILRQACFLDRKMFRQCSTVILWFVIFMAHSFFSFWLLQQSCCSGSASVSGFLVVVSIPDCWLSWVYVFGVLHTFSGFQDTCQFLLWFIPWCHWFCSVQSSEKDLGLKS